MKSFSEKIKEHRSLLGLSQRQLATKLELEFEQ